MIILFNYVVSLFSLVLFIVSLGYGSVFFIKNKILLLIGFFLITFVVLNVSPLSSHEEIKQICNSLNLKESQCSIIDNKNKDDSFELLIEFRKKDDCVLIKDNNFICSDKKETFSFYKEKPLNFLLKADVSLIIQRFNSNKERIVSLKNNF